MESPKPKITVFDINRATHFFAFDTSMGKTGTLYQINVPANEDYLKALSVFPDSQLGKLTKKIEDKVIQVYKEEFAYLLDSGYDNKRFTVSFVYDQLIIFVDVRSNKGKYQEACEKMYRRIVNYLNNVEVKISFGPVDYWKGEKD